MVGFVTEVLGCRGEKGGGTNVALKRRVGSKDLPRRLGGGGRRARTLSPPWRSRFVRLSFFWCSLRDEAVHCWSLFLLLVFEAGSFCEKGLTDLS